MSGSFYFHTRIKKPGLLCIADRAIFLILNVLFVYIKTYLLRRDRTL